MRTSKFTEEQIVGLLREAEKGEDKLEALCRSRGITVQTYYRWRKRSGRLIVLSHGPLFHKIHRRIL